MDRKTFLKTATGLAALAALAPPSTLVAAGLDSGRPVKLILGYAAGGATDVIARLVAQQLTDLLGQTFIVDNRPGANGNIGADIVAKSKPDGTTLLLGTISNAINASLYKNLPFDFERDLAPIGLVATAPNVLVVNLSVPAKNLAEFVAYVRAHPGQVNYGSAGTGSSIHLSGELFNMLAGTTMVHVPYKGSAPAMTDLIGGQIQAMFDNAPSAMPHVQSGGIRALGVTTPRRSRLLPDIPTIAEGGVPNYDVTTWFALYAPARTPDAVVARLNEALNKGLRNEQVRQRLAGLGADAAGGSPQQLASFLAQEVKKWAAVVKASGATAD